MKNFFQHTTYKYNERTTRNLKSYCRAIENLAKLTERSTFLQRCRRLGITPKHIAHTTKHIKTLYNTPTMQLEIERIELNLQTKLLNAEIKETHINIKTKRQEIEQLEANITNTLNETELENFRHQQWNKYKNIKANNRKTLLSKIEKLRNNKFEEMNLQFNEDWFVNYTNIEFPKESKWLLSLGSKFALPVHGKNFFPVPIIADIEQWVQTIKDDTDKEFARAKIANRISNYKRKLNNSDGEKFILGIYEDTRSFIKKYKDTIMITTADKGNKTVIMYKQDYEDKMNGLLEDKSTYKTIRIDPTGKLEKKNNNIITKLLKDNYITKWEKIKLTSNAAASPQLYGLPKIHKNDVPLRPIASSKKVPCYQLAKYVGKILKNLISPTYNIKNSVELKEQIQTIVLDNDEILVSFDVVSLFTNIPIHLAIKNILDKWKILERHTTIPRRSFLQILQFCLNDNNYFTYADKIYQQTYGMPMGNPLSPTIADIVLDTLLDTTIGELKSANVEIKHLSKYVDDIFAIINKKDADTILKTLNTYHNRIQFTVEIEKNGQIPYLDMEIIRQNESLMTNWYTKKTSSGRMINYHSTQPQKMKINTAINLIKKVHYIGDEKFDKDNMKKVANILAKNNYPINIIKSLMKKAQHETSKKRDNSETTFFSVPYIPRLTESKTLRSITIDEKISFAHKSNQTIQRLFSKRTTTIDKLKQNNVVYEIKCRGNENEACGRVYVGTTRRMLSVRINEHEADVRKGKENTALSQHIKECQHVADFQNIKILDTERRENTRYTLESLRIQQRMHKSMNTKEDKDATKLQYSIAIL